MCATISSTPTQSRRIRPACLARSCDLTSTGATPAAPSSAISSFYRVGFEGLNRRTGVTDTYTVLSQLGRSSVVDPQIKNFVATYMPLPNLAPTASNPYLALLVRNDVSAVREDIGTARVDYNWSDGADLFFRYNIHDTDSTTPFSAARKFTRDASNSPRPVGRISSARP